MGEAKRRKKILGEAYGRQETSGQLAKAKRQLAEKFLEGLAASRL